MENLEALKRGPFGSFSWKWRSLEWVSEGRVTAVEVDVTRSD